MATYSETSFDSKHYEDSRPNYPQSFYDTLISYHDVKASRELGVDIGCGSGFVAFKLAEYFKRVVGTDPSEVMIKQCNLKQNQNITFLQGTAEVQPLEIKENSVDIITGAECCHWVDHPRFFAESARVLKPNGTLAYWFYKDPIFVGFPKANKIYENYTYNSSFDINPDDEFERYMGPYYQQPGHDFLRTLMKEIEVPTESFYDIVRNEYRVDDDDSPLDTAKTPLSIRKKITLKLFLAYVQSWSAYHSWMKDHGHKYDIAERFVAELKRELNWDDETVVDVVWDTVYTFARKR